MSRGYTNFSGMEPFTDGWKRAVYSGLATSYHVYRPIIMESEGMKMQISHYSSGHCGESYVVKSERILEHVPVPTVTLVAEYRCISGPGEEEMLNDYTVDKRYTRFGSCYNHPDEKVEEFLEELLTKVQGEVSQLTKAVLPLSSGRRTSPKRTGQEGSKKYRDDSNFKGSDWNKMNSNPARDRHILQYNNGAYPMTNSKVNGGHVTYIGKSSLANPQQPRLNVPSVQKKETVHSSPEATDSSEARRRYGKLPSLPATDEAYERTITSKDAAMKYKGALIP